MQEGGRIHRMIQRRMGSDYHAEVSLRWIQPYPDYDLVVEGRADGIVDTVPATVDEIKGTYRDLDRMRGRSRCIWRRRSAMRGYTDSSMAWSR